MRVRFLGVAGFLITRGDQAVLTGPMFTNPSWLRVGLGHIAPDPVAIEEGLARAHVTHSDLSRVRAIVVGDGHYDHFMESTYFARKYGVPVYANHSAKLNAAAIDATLRFEDLEQKAVTYEEPHPEAKWTTITDPANGDIRILAIRSEHSPQFLGNNLWPGGLVRKPDHPPRTAAEMPQGVVLAFLIDFMDKSVPAKVAFRVHYADSPSDPTCGLIPSALDKRVVDLAIIGSGGTQDMHDFPEAIFDNTCASHVLLGHWESFFERFKDEKGLKALAGAETVLWKVRKRNVSMGKPADEGCFPVPGTAFAFPIVEPAEDCPRSQVWPPRHCGCRPAP